MAGDCPICARHRGEGPLGGELVARVDGFWVWHAAPGQDGGASLGHVIIESDRHAPHLDDLTDVEAGNLGRLRAHLARALRDELRPEFVFAAVIGQRMSHFHEHLLCRFPGTAEDVPWHESDEAAPRADAAAVVDLARRIHTRLAH
jgi:diadenosine tetraphosphate (Ap4A) HIT family hydrolase